VRARAHAQVEMNGRPLGLEFKRNSAYVAQEDCFVPTMSALETLEFNAALTLPKAVGPEERAKRISEVLHIMGLWRSRDTQARPLHARVSQAARRAAREAGTGASRPAWCFETPESLAVPTTVGVSACWPPASTQPSSGV